VEPEGEEGNIYIYPPCLGDYRGVGIIDIIYIKVFMGV
jgi:hypothetical protein